MDINMLSVAAQIMVINTGCIKHRSLSRRINKISSQRSCFSVRVFSQLGNVSEGMIYRRSRLLIHYLALSTGYLSITPDTTILFAASRQFLNTQFTLIPIRTDSAYCSNSRGFMPRDGSEGMPSVGTMWQLTRISWWSEDQCLYSSRTCPLV